MTVGTSRVLLGQPAAASDWLLEVPAQAAQPVLVVFPHAGSGASGYLRLAQSVRDVCRPLIVRLPGRENRLGEAPLTDLRQVVRALAPVLQPRLGQDFVLYGHSMGALIAFEVARVLSLAYGMHPRRLIVSGMEAPQDCVATRNRHLLTDDQLWEVVHRMGGLPPEVAAEPAMRQMILPVLRTDFQITDEYAFRVAPRLDCPISAFAGSADSELTPREMLGWQVHTQGSFEHVELSGEHFFNLDPDSGFAERLRRSLAN
jgi:medium-chain acyl-[acyl-carrier-protein] hydrolase